MVSAMSICSGDVPMSDYDESMYGSSSGASFESQDYIAPFALNRWLYDTNVPITQRLWNPLRDPRFALFVWRQHGAPRFGMPGLPTRSVEYDTETDDRAQLLLGIGAQFDQVYAPNNREFQFDSGMSPESFE